jgi:hypothetical protein
MRLLAALIDLVARLVRPGKAPADDPEHENVYPLW